MYTFETNSAALFSNPNLRNGRIEREGERAKEKEGGNEREQKRNHYITAFLGYVDQLYAKKQSSVVIFA